MNAIMKGIMMTKVTAIDIMQRAIELKERKSEDYQGSQFTEEQYFPFGNLSYIHMLHTKMLRIRSVAEKDGEQNFESLSDSLIDLINYAAMMAAYVDNNDPTVYHSAKKKKAKR
jgi:hypothetical protein